MTDPATELRRALAEIKRLTEENGDLLQRLAYAHREIEELRERLAAARTAARKAGDPSAGMKTT